MPMLLSILLMMLLSVKTEGINLIISSFMNFFSSPKVDVSILTSLQIIPAGITIAIALSVIAVGIAKVCGADFSDHKGFGDINKISFWTFGLFLLTVEEGVFRIIPMQLANRFGWNVGITLIISAALFALVHLGNFADKSKNPLVTLPQFFSGLLFSAVAISFGWWTAFLFHFFFDLVLFSADKRQKYSTIDLILVAYFIILAGIGYRLSGGFDVNFNLNTFEKVALTNNQVIGSVFLVYGLVSGVINLLGFDTVQMAKTDDKDNLAKNIFISVFAGVLSTVLALAAYRYGASLFQSHMEELTVYITLVAVSIFPFLKLFGIKPFDTVLLALIGVLGWSFLGNAQLVNVANLISQNLNFVYNPLMILLICAFSLSTVFDGIKQISASQKGEIFEVNSSASEMAGRAFSMISTSYLFLVVYHSTISQVVWLGLALIPALSIFVFLQMKND